MSSAPNTTRTSLVAARDLIMPAVYQLEGHAAKNGIPIISADIDIDFVYDQLRLHVSHRLLSGRELYASDWKSEVAPRIRAAMELFHRMPQAKAVSLQRRRLLARGERATKNKPRHRR